ncbi:MAG: hypothetical protein L6408_08185 [Nanoarchaeota archaeon]|nr:hypothetical protein [Nanoarchaeota archaeon]
MFKKITLWCEFPDTVYWKKAIKLIDFKVKIYIAVKSKKEFLEYKKKIKSKYITLAAWPILPKSQGYWFSGLTPKKGIDKLKQFKGMDIKIDLEPPIPPFDYNNFKIVLWLIEMFFRKAKNKKYLRETIYWLAKNNTKILVNEFPLPKFYMEKLGITIEKKYNMTLQMMMYTSPPGRLLRPLVKWYNKRILRKSLKDNKSMLASIGLIGPGILNTEGYYRNTNDFYGDLEMVQSAGLENVTIYSIDSIMHRENPKEWLDTLKKFTS